MCVVTGKLHQKFIGFVYIRRLHDDDYLQVIAEAWRQVLMQ